MIPNHIALVSLTSQITDSDLAVTASALQKQITRDLGPLWNIEATIDSFPDMGSVPVGYWPITISDAEKIDDADDEGYHWSDAANQPFAIVKFDNTWQLTCSHEMCEMLVDPYGNKTFVSDSIQQGQGRVNYLVEVCDPCEDTPFGYPVNGIILSDFYTPNYFDPVHNVATRYSYTGAITAPKQVLKNGYLTWQDPTTGKWFQANYFGDAITYNDITDQMQSAGPVRSRVDRITKNKNKNETFHEEALKYAGRKMAFERSTKGFQELMIREIGKFVKI